MPFHPSTRVSRGNPLKLDGYRTAEEMNITLVGAVGPGQFHHVLVMDRSVDEVGPHIGNVEREHVIVETLADTEAVAVGVGEYRPESGVRNGVFVVHVTGTEIKILRQRILAANLVAPDILPVQRLWFVIKIGKLRTIKLELQFFH